MGRKRVGYGQRDGSKHLNHVVHCAHPGCDKVFSRKDHLRRHEKLHESQAGSSRDATSSTEPSSQGQRSTSTPFNALAQYDALIPSFPATDCDISRGGLLSTSVDGLDLGIAGSGSASESFDWNAFFDSIVQSTVSPVNPTSFSVFGQHDEASFMANDWYLSGDFNTDNEPQAIDQSLRDRLIHSIPPDRLLECPPDILTVEALRLALDTYWMIFDPQFPIIHRGSYDPHGSSPRRLLVMLAIGQYHQNPRLTALASVVLSIRGELLVELSGDMNLVDLQTLVLCHMYDEWMSTSKAHYQAQCFSATLIAVLRRRSLLVRYEQPEPSSWSTINEQWRAWVEDETAVRLAYGLMTIDAHLAPFWGQVCSRRHSPLLLQLRLPASHVLWTAKDAVTWIDASRTSGHRVQDAAAIDDNFVPAMHVPYESGRVLPGYSRVLKAVLEAKGDAAECRPFFNRLLLLHGLNMLVWDIRIHGSVSLIGRVSVSWRQSLHYAILKLADTASEEGEPAIASRYFRDAMTLSIISLFGDVTQIQVFAGARTVSGCTIRESHQVHCREKLSNWVSSVEGKIAEYHAKAYLQETFVSNLFVESTVLAPWTVYVCTLVCYAISTAGRSINKIARAPPQQVAIHKALEYLKEADGITQNSAETISGLYCLLSSAHFYIQEKAAQWGIGVEAMTLLSSLMSGLLADT